MIRAYVSLCIFLLNRFINFFVFLQFEDKIPRYIVLEYCNGGDLATALEKPENHYGLPESEFLLVLKHTSKITG
jgi:hypothetical protein